MNKLLALLLILNISSILCWRMFSENQYNTFRTNIQGPTTTPSYSGETQTQSEPLILIGENGNIYLFVIINQKN